MSAEPALTLQSVPPSIAENDGQFLPSRAPLSTEEQSLPELELELVKQLKARRAMPVLPAVAQSAMRLANDPDARIQDVAKLIDTDPPLAARFMSLANHVIDFRGWVTSSTQSAVLRLGLASTRDLLFQVVYARTSGGLKHYQGAVQASFRRSVIAAHAARIASRELSLGGEYGYMSGLLHDIGEARIYRIFDGLKRKPSSAQLESLVLSYHASAGAEVARSWRLPSELVDACAAHHGPTAAGLPHVRLVMIADCVVAALEAESGHARREVDFEPFDMLLIDPRIARRLIEKTRPFIADDAKL
jgi:putative nucleotidyltransferase with HDIG domain